MLEPVSHTAQALAILGEPQPSQFTFRNFVARPGVQLFVSNSTAALVAISGTNTMVATLDAAARFESMRDLFAGSFAADAQWPNADARKNWQRRGQPYIFLDSSPIAVWESGLEAGFVPPPDYDKDHYANLYWFQGQPRFSEQIAHSCRLGRGPELWEQLRSGVGYDPEGHYVRLILQENPSFVCEVAGRPVCWSTIHLNGTMGMIYTPPEHRRHGYARSLACFQIDHVLRNHGIACCHVNSENVASYSMLLEFGATKEETKIGWRLLQWPDGSCPYSV